MLPGSVLLAGLAIVIAGIMYGGIYETTFLIPSLILFVAAGGWLAANPIKRGPSSSFGLPELSLGLLGIYWAIRGMNPFVSEGWIAGGMIAAGGIAYLAGRAAASNPGARWVWVGVLLGGALLQLTIGLYELRNDSAPLPWLSEKLRLWYEGRFSDRLHGFFLNPNQAAWWLNFASLMGVSLTLWARVPLAVKMILGAVTGMFIWGSFLTFSRGGLLGLAAGMLAFTLISALILLLRVRKLRWPLILVGSALAIGGFLLLKTGVEQLPQYSTKFLIAANEGDYRSKIWPTAWREFQTAPLLGSGAGSFVYAGRKYREDLYASDPRFAHNDWLQVAAEYGIIGFLLVIGVLSVHFGQLVGKLDSLKNHPDFRDGLPQDTALALQLGAWGGLVTAGVHSFFDFNLQVPANLWLALISLGCLNAHTSQVQVFGNTAFSRLKQGIPSLIPAALGIILLVVLIREGPSIITNQQVSNQVARSAIPPRSALTRQFQAFNPDSIKTWEVLASINSANAKRLIDPSAAAHFRRMAAAAYAQAINLSPNERLLRLQFGNQLLHLGRPAPAATEFARAAELDPFYSSPYYFLGLAAESRQQPAAAREFYQLAIRLPGNSNAAGSRLQKLLQTTSNK